MKDAQIEELLLEALETELCGAKVYETALKCVTNKDLLAEWGKYLEETKHHIQVVERLFGELGLGPATRIPGSTDALGYPGGGVSGWHGRQNEDSIPL